MLLFLAEVTVTRRRGGAVNGCPGEALPWPGFLLRFCLWLFGWDDGGLIGEPIGPADDGFVEGNKMLLSSFFQLLHSEMGGRCVQDQGGDG